MRARRRYWPAPCGPLILTSIRGRCARGPKGEKRPAVSNIATRTFPEERVSPMTHEKMTLLLAQGPSVSPGVSASALPLALLDKVEGCLPSIGSKRAKVVAI
jgi:hypothetical protein